MRWQNMCQAKNAPSTDKLSGGMEKNQGAHPKRIDSAYKY
jgi:hypothetical protein